MQFGKAQVRAVKAKTGLIAIGFSIGEGKICDRGNPLLEHRTKTHTRVAPVAFISMSSSSGFGAAADNVRGDQPQLCSLAS